MIAVLTISFLAACVLETDTSKRSGERRDGSRRSGASRTSEASVSVKATHAVRRAISRFLISNTTLEAIRKVSIHAKVGALVESILVEEGSFVKKGQLLVTMDDQEIRNEYDQARIALDQTALTLEQAGVKAKLSQSEFARAKDLLDQKLISPQEYDQTALINETDDLGLRVGQQQKAGAAARLAAAKLQLNYTEIRSPISGVITERLIEVGGLVNINQQTFTVEDFTPLWSRIFIPERELSQIRIGQRATLRFQAYPEKKFQGRIQMINPTVDPESGTVKVTLEVLRTKGLLRPGMFGTVYIAIETREQALVIPKRAVLRERDENHVFLLMDTSVVSKRNVVLGFTEGNHVEVVSGLEEGDPVVTIGQEGLNDGYTVNVLEWEDDSEGSLQPNATKSGIVEKGPNGRSENPLQKAQKDRSSEKTQLANSRKRSSAIRGEQEGHTQAGTGRVLSGAMRGGMQDPERMRSILDSMSERNPLIREVYEDALKKNPGLLDDAEKLRLLMREIRSRFGRNRQ
jgi:membrane fusion protein (multidrug efflux system)